LGAACGFFGFDEVGFAEVVDGEAFFGCGDVIGPGLIEIETGDYGEEVDLAGSS